MSVATVVVAAVAAIAGFSVAPFAQRLIDETPPAPEDDPPPVRRVGPWLAQRHLLGLCLAVVAAAVAARTGPHPAAAAQVVAAIGLVVLSVIDLDLFLLPKRIVWPLTGATLLLLAGAAAIAGSGTPLWRAVAGGAGAFGALFVLHFISPNGMGFGDVRLAALIGLVLGWFGVEQIVAGMFAGFLIAAVVGVALMATGKRSRHDAVPFGPFLALGTLFVLVGGDLLLGLTRA